MSLRQCGILSLFLAVLGITAAQGQPNPLDNPLLKRAQAEQKLLTQKLEGELKAALAEAARVQPTSKIRAANVLKVALSKLEDPLVPAAFRQEWTAQLNAAIARIDRGENPTPPEAIDPVRKEMKEAQKARAQAIIEERDSIRKTVEKIQALSRGGRPDLAQEEVVTLQKKYPDNPVTMVLAENTIMNQRIADARVLVAQQNEGYRLAMKSLEKSSIMPKDDIEFDVARWKEITKARLQSPLTAKEKALIKALDSQVDLNYKDAPFDEVIKSLSNAMGQNILMEKTALQAAMIESSTPTSISAKGITVRTALRKILNDHGLTYIIRDQAIQVVTLDTARNSLVTRVYYLGDLASGVGPFGGALRWGPMLDMMQTEENVRQVIQTIQGSIDPLSWKEKGGNGTITFHWPSMSLIIRQSAEVHGKLGMSLGGGIR